MPNNNCQAKTQLPKLIVILGPTASGKSGLAVELAKKYNGEIISADSRQVYRGMDIGTGKVPISYERSEFTKSSIPSKDGIQMFYKGIRHHLLDVADPKRRFTVARYKRLAQKAIKDIQKRGKLPIICGGTGFYIRAITDDLPIPEVKPDLKLRARLEKKSVGELFSELKRLDPARAATIEPKNPRRLIRALEIIYKTGKPVPSNSVIPAKAGIQIDESGFRVKPGMTNGEFDTLFIGIQKSPTELKKLIHKRLLKRLKQGMIAEVKNLHASGLSWKRLDSFGLEYRWITKYLQKKISYQEMIAGLQKDSEHYAKRQMVWFKKYPGGKVRWIKNKYQTEKLINKYLKKEGSVVKNNQPFTNTHPLP